MTVNSLMAASLTHAHCLPARPLSKTWLQATFTCLSSLRLLQNRLPTRALSAPEARFLWLNRADWAGHSRWLVQLLKALDTPPVAGLDRCACCGVFRCLGLWL